MQDEHCPHCGNDSPRADYSVPPKTSEVEKWRIRKQSSVLIALGLPGIKCQVSCTGRRAIESSFEKAGLEELEVMLKSIPSQAEPPPIRPI